MAFYIFAWIFCVYSGDLRPENRVQANMSIRISGTCYNVGTGVGLKISVLALFKKSKLALGQSNESGGFDFLIPDSTKYLSFTREGYRTTTIPVNFIGPIASESKFRIGVPMSARDSLPLKPINELALSFTVPDSLDITYELTQPAVSAHYTYFEFKRGKHPYHFLIRDFKPGEYLLTASTGDGVALLNEPMITGTGLNFKAIYIKKLGEATPVTESKQGIDNVDKSLDSKTLYFGQSSYELRTETKSTLDSIARLLAKQPDMVAHVTGYTDNVGKRELNVTLAEYRARIVMNYLRQQGVKPDQLIAIGKGPDTVVAVTDSEEAKTRSRRVVIQFSRK